MKLKALPHGTTRQFVQLFCWLTDLEHPHARTPVVIKAVYPIITIKVLPYYCYYSLLSYYY